MSVVAAALAAVALAATPSVPSLILKPAQVGKGYVLFARSDGFGLKTRTLDLCGVTNYPSEKLRTARLQVNYLKQHGTFGLSNEVVAYKPGGTAQALRELAQHATTCPHHAISPGEQGLPPLTFQITRLRDSGLLPGALAVQIHVTSKAKVNGKPVDDTSCAVYQRHGNVLSGVYSFLVPGAHGAVGDQVKFCLHAAEQSAKDLLGGAPSGPTA